eukprot:11205428-Lingulodinium_polyedra.AAC.1
MSSEITLRNRLSVQNWTSKTRGVPETVHGVSNVNRQRPTRRSVIGSFANERIVQHTVRNTREGGSQRTTRPSQGLAATLQ